MQFSSVKIANYLNIMKIAVKKLGNEFVNGLKGLAGHKITLSMKLGYIQPGLLKHITCPLWTGGPFAA
jgi:hypothetical protein